MYLLFSLFLWVNVASSATNDLCDILKIKNCKGVTKQLRRSSSSTIPSTTTAVSFNPANVSFDKGLGLDTVYQSGNPLLFGLTTGTGKMGGALINGSIENSFFGNRVPELDRERFDREEEEKQYRNNKISIGIGGRLFSNRNFGLDAGVILKKHPLISQVNPGFGVSARLWKLSLGASAYRDNFYIDQGTGTSLKEEFTVRTFTSGTRIGNFGFDYGVIFSSLNFYKTPTDITIYSGSYHVNNFLFNVAYRKEHSQAPEYTGGLLEANVKKDDFFLATQYSINSNVILGISYNYFLLREFSLAATLFL